MTNKSKVKLNGVITNKSGLDLNLKKLLSELEDVGVVFTGQINYEDGDNKENFENRDNKENFEVQNGRSVKDPNGKTSSITKSAYPIKKKDPNRKPIKTMYHDSFKVSNAEKKGLMVSMDNVVDKKRTKLNKALSSYFIQNNPKYAGVFSEGENGLMEAESLLDNINQYLKENGLDKRIHYPNNHGAEIFLIPITENLDLKVLAVDEYFGEGYSSQYVQIDRFMINENTTKEDVDQLNSFINKFFV